MKKFLLLAGVVALGFNTMMAEEEDITPKGYIFHETGKMCTIHPYFFHGANIQNTEAEFNSKYGVASVGNVWKDIQGEEFYNDGLVVLAGGNWHAGNKPEKPTEANWMQVVDLGGEVGHVLALVPAGSYAADAVAALKEATGEDYDLKTPTSMWKSWGNINFLMDKKKSPVADEAKVRCDIVFNAYGAPNATGNAVNNFYFKTSEKGVRGEMYPALALNTCFVENADEDMAFEPSKWCKYSVIFDIPAADEGEEDNKYAPVWLNFNIPGPSDAKGILFIREIRFTKIDPEAEVSKADDVTPEFVTLKPGKPGVSGVANVAAEVEATVSVNGNVATFNAPAEVYTLMGAKVAQGKEVSLSNGIYVARVGSQAVKFVVK